MVDKWWGQLHELGFHDYNIQTRLKKNQIQQSGQMIKTIAWTRFPWFQCTTLPWEQAQNLTV